MLVFCTVLHVCMCPNAPPSPRFFSCQVYILENFAVGGRRGGAERASRCAERAPRCAEQALGRAERAQRRAGTGTPVLSGRRGGASAERALAAPSGHLALRRRAGAVRVPVPRAPNVPSGQCRAGTVGTAPSRRSFEAGVEATVKMVEYWLAQ